MNDQDPFDGDAIRRIVLLGFPDVELLDLTGPFEVLSTAAQRLPEETRPQVLMAAPDEAPFASRNGLRLQAATTLDAVGDVDLLVVPGGRGVRALLEDGAFLARLAELVERSRVVLSICTGSWLLARLGLLAGRHATSHHEGLERLAELAPDAVIHADRRWVEDGPFVLSAGVSAGIDASFHVVERLWGAELAAAVARHIEYPWSPGDAG